MFPCSHRHLVNWREEETDGGVYRLAMEKRRTKPPLYRYLAQDHGKGGRAVGGVAGRPWVSDLPVQGGERRFTEAKARAPAQVAFLFDLYRLPK